MTRKSLIGLVSTLALLLLGLSGPALADSQESWQAGKCKAIILASNHTEASRRHLVACQAWCRANPQCVRCSRLPACGPGYRRLRAWTGRGTNYYACARTRPGMASDHRQRECQRWCRANPQCVRCSRLPACGPGYRRIHSFRGRGINWYACARSASGAASDQNRAACQTWCRANPQCVRCSPNLTCGRGYQRLRSFRGRGRNWHACRRR